MNIQLALADCYQEVQKSAEEKMREITLAQILTRYHQKLEESQSLEEDENGFC